MSKDDIKKMLTEAANVLQAKASIAAQALLDTTNAEVNRVLTTLYQTLEKSLPEEKKEADAA